VSPRAAGACIASVVVIAGGCSSFLTLASTLSTIDLGCKPTLNSSTKVSRIGSASIACVST